MNSAEATNKVHRAAWIGLGLQLLLAPCLLKADLPAGASYGRFQKVLAGDNESQIDRVGGALLKELSQKYRHDEEFMAVTSKWAAAEFLARQMVSQLTIATDVQMKAAPEDIFGSASKAKPHPSALVAPAKEFYETACPLFFKAIHIQNLSATEKTFLAQYYNYRLSLLVQRIAKAGLALAIAEPGFKGTYDYMLVLPLLHVTEPQGLDIKVLPRWARQPDQLAILEESCLLHYGLPFQAMKLAQSAAQSRRQPFSQVEFFKSAARQSGAAHANIAVDCLNRALCAIPNRDAAQAIQLEFQIFQIWRDSENFPLAAAQAKKIADSYPDHPDYGRAVSLYFSALASARDAGTVLLNIDPALQNRKCLAHKSQLLFIKWWALRRSRDQPVALAALEAKLLQEYEDNPVVAPVMFSQAMDCLAGQDPGWAHELLRQLVEKFPSSKSAVQAERIIQRLTAAHDYEKSAK